MLFNCCTTVCVCALCACSAAQPQTRQDRWWFQKRFLLITSPDSDDCPAAHRVGAVSPTNFRCCVQTETYREDERLRQSCDMETNNEINRLCVVCVVSGRLRDLITKNIQKHSHSCLPSRCLPPSQSQTGNHSYRHGVELPPPLGGIAKNVQVIC